MTEIVFSSKVPAADPSERPVTILGKLGNLKKVSYNDVIAYLAPKVSAEVSARRREPASSFLHCMQD